MRCTKRCAIAAPTRERFTILILNLSRRCNISVNYLRANLRRQSAIKLPAEQKCPVLRATVELASLVNVVTPGSSAVAGIVFEISCRLFDKKRETIAFFFRFLYAARAV